MIELNSGPSLALQALSVDCTTQEDRNLRNFLLKSSIVQLNGACTKSENDRRMLFCVRLLQGLASEAIGTHEFAQLYLSECLPQLLEGFTKITEDTRC